MAVKIARLFGKGHLPIAKVLRTLQVEFVTQICSKYQITEGPPLTRFSLPQWDFHVGQPKTK